MLINNAGVAAFTSLLNGPRGIAVHTVNPGPIDTELAKEFPADKASPQETAERIIQGIENDQADIFPDDGGRQMFDVWNNDYRDLEAMVNQMHHAA